MDALKVKKKKKNVKNRFNCLTLKMGGRASWRGGVWERLVIAFMFSVDFFSVHLIEIRGKVGPKRLYGILIKL